jgi:uncharacterized protein YoxC
MDDVTKLTYWLDIIIKTAIGIVVTLAGMDYRQVKGTLKDLETSKYKLVTQVEVLQVEVKGISHRLERIDQKIDQLIERRR